MSCPVVTFTTDFGLMDGFVGTMKGVVLGICPEATIVDITHDVPPQNVRTGGLLLRAAHSFFPDGTIHVAVVDPGVGSDRRAILVRDENFLYLGPDNGLLTFVLEREGIKVWELSNQGWFLPERSKTFDGRDVFAPAAAHLALGANPEDAGPEISGAVRSPLPTPFVEVDEREHRVRIHGVVIHVDRFGNLITNIDRAAFKKALSSAPERVPRVFVSGRRIGELVPFYQMAKKGMAAALINSWGLLEIFVSFGDAALTLSSGIEDPVVVEIG
jgi:S-adenosylmethionine hydrolase